MVFSENCLADVAADFGGGEREAFVAALSLYLETFRLFELVGKIFRRGRQNHVHIFLNRRRTLKSRYAENFFDNLNGLVHIEAVLCGLNGHG